jgi:hypothetical protein
VHRGVVVGLVVGHVPAGDEGYERSARIGEVRRAPASGPCQGVDFGGRVVDRVPDRSAGPDERAGVLRRRQQREGLPQKHHGADAQHDKRGAPVCAIISAVTTTPAAVAVAVAARMSASSTCAYRRRARREDRRMTPCEGLRRRTRRSAAARDPAPRSGRARRGSSQGARSSQRSRAARRCRPRRCPSTRTHAERVRIRVAPLRAACLSGW